MKKLRFIISIFGDRHVNMLMPLLFSIRTSCPNAHANIYWEDIKSETQDILKNGFSEFTFTDTHFNFTKDITRRISSKTLSWEYAARQQRESDEWLLFIDVDTLVIKDPLPLLNEINADVIITHRNESQFLINTGVIACKNRRDLPYFFTQWQQETMNILGHPDLFAQANDKNLHHGGADQMSLQKLINYSKTQDTFTFQNIILKTVHCKFLNETYSSPITKDTHIIHYKGGWRDIIFFGGNFTKNRTKKDSWEMYIYYLRTFCKSVVEMNHRLNTSLTHKDFHLIIPFYLNTRTWEEYPILYVPFFIFSHIKSFPNRLFNLCRETLLNKIK